MDGGKVRVQISASPMQADGGKQGHVGYIPEGRAQVLAILPTAP